MDLKTKKCSKCGEVKPLDEFNLVTTASGTWYRGGCKACALEEQRKYRAADPERARAMARAAYAADPAAGRRKTRAFYSAHAEEVRAAARVRHAQNRAGNNAKTRLWSAAHRAECAAKCAARAAAKLRATPKWADQAKVLEVYEKARALTKLTGIEHHVDHIVPLKSKVVSGLHVEFNLRALPKLDNISKGNRYWPDMP